MALLEAASQHADVLDALLAREGSHELNHLLVELKDLHLVLTPHSLLLHLHPHSPHELTGALTLLQTHQTEVLLRLGCFCQLDHLLGQVLHLAVNGNVESSAPGQHVLCLEDVDSAVHHHNASGLPGHRHQTVVAESQVSGSKRNGTFLGDFEDVSLALLDGVLHQPVHLLLGVHVNIQSLQVHHVVLGVILLFATGTARFVG